MVVGILLRAAALCAVLTRVCGGYISWAWHCLVLVLVLASPGRDHQLAADSVDRYQHQHTARHHSSQGTTAALSSPHTAVTKLDHWTSSQPQQSSVIIPVLDVSY